MQKGRFNRSAPSCHPSFLVPHTQLAIANNSRPVATSTGCNLSANPSTSRLWNSVASPERCCAHTSTRAKLGPCFTDHSCRENRHADKEGSSNRATLTLITKRSHMRHPQHSGLLTLLLTLAHSAALCTPSLAGDVALLSIGPRFGFSGKTPILGKEQKHYFHTIDVAAVFKLPWSWPLGESSWSLETRLITSAGLLQAANESGLIATVVPNLALRGWGGTCHLRRRSGGRILQQLHIRHARLRRSGSNHRDCRDSRQPILARLCRISCTTLLRRRPVRIFQSRRGHVHCGTRIPVLVWMRRTGDPVSQTTGHHHGTLSRPP